MNEKLQYEQMLDLPVNSASVAPKPSRRRSAKRKNEKNVEEVKQELVDKVNCLSAQEDSQNQGEEQVVAQESIQAVEETQVQSEQTVTIRSSERVKKGGFKFSIITAQLMVIGALVAIIFLTNAFYENSGINVFFKTLFNTNEQSVSIDKEHTDFAPVVMVGNGTPTLSEGIITFSASGSVYAPCDGKVKTVTALEGNKYEMVIEHSDNFSSVITGLDFAYASVGDTVYGALPVGYLKDGQVQMCFCNAEGGLISNFDISGSNVIWAV